MNDRKKTWKAKDDDLYKRKMKQNARLRDIYERNELDDPITAITVKA